MKKIIALALFSVLLVSCFSLTAMAKTEYLTFGTSDIGGVWFAEGAALSTQWNSAIEGIQISCDTRGGGTGNAFWMATGKVDLAINNTPGIKAAKEGVGWFKDKGKQDFGNVRALAALHKSYLTVVAKEGSDIEHVEDIRGKRIAVGQPGNSIQTVLPMICNVWGWSYEDELKKEYIADYDAFDALRAGRIDAIVEWIGLGAGAYAENFEKGGVKLVGMKDSSLAKLHEEYPFYIEGEIPEGVYKGQGPINVPFTQDFLTVQKDLSDDLVYQMCKVMHKHLEDGTLAATHRAFKEAGFPSYIELISLVEIHPGAEKFYNEIGVEIEN